MSESPEAPRAAGAAPDASAAPPPLLSLDGVEVRRGTFRLVLSELSLQVGRGELVFVTGASGSGKSTLLRLIAGMLEPTAGRIRVAGQDLARLRARARAHLRRQIGIVPQVTALFDECNAIENVAAPALIAGERRSEAVERARIAIERVGLDLARIGALRAAALSAGERRRLMLARAIASRPALLLIDEPPNLEAGGAGAGSDPAAEPAAAPSVDIVIGNPATDPLVDLLGLFCRTGVSAIVATRDPLPSAAAPFVRRLRLAEGRLQQAGAAA